MQLHPFCLTAELGSPASSGGVRMGARAQVNRRPDAPESDWSVSGHDH
jgi:hypothetical protein